MESVPLAVRHALLVFLDSTDCNLTPHNNSALRSGCWLGLALLANKLLGEKPPRPVVDARIRGLTQNLSLFLNGASVQRAGLVF